MQFGGKDHLRFLSKYDPDNELKVRTVKIKVSERHWNRFKIAATRMGKTAQELLSDLVILVEDLEVKDLD